MDGKVMLQAFRSIRPAKSRVAMAPFFRRPQTLNDLTGLAMPQNLYGPLMLKGESPIGAWRHF